MYEQPRETANRFVGGAENRLGNLRRLLEYVAGEETVGRQALFEWLVARTPLQTEGTFDKHLRFIVGIGLLDKTGGPIDHPGDFSLGPYGVTAIAALEDSDDELAHVIFDALANRVHGFDHLYDVLQDQPIDVENRAEVLSAGYEEREFSDNVAEKHYTWLQAIGYIEETNGQYVLTDLGAKATNRPRQAIQSLDERTPSTLREWTGAAHSDRGTHGEQEVSYVADVGELVDKTAAHEDALDVLVDQLTAEGFTCGYTAHSDLLATRDDTVILVEAKTITPTSAFAQIRSAIGQLFEYEFYDVEQRAEWASHNVVSCLYLASPPGPELQEYLRHLPSRGIEVVWQNSGTVEGPSWPDMIPE